MSSYSSRKSTVLPKIGVFTLLATSASLGMVAKSGVYQFDIWGILFPILLLITLLISFLLIMTSNPLGGMVLFGMAVIMPAFTFVILVNDTPLPISESDPLRIPIIETAQMR